MPRRAGLLVLLVILWPSTSRAGDAVDPAVVGVLGAGDYQTDLPGLESHPDAASSTASRRSQRKASGAGGADGGASLTEAASKISLAGLLLRLLLGIVLVVVVAWVIVRLRGRVSPAVHRASIGFQPGGAAPMPKDPGGPTRDPRILLWRALRMLRARELLVLGAATTGREALRRARLDGDALGALERLVQAVEATAFGGQPLGEEEQDDCGASFRLLSEHVETLEGTE